MRKAGEDAEIQAALDAAANAPETPRFPSADDWMTVDGPKSLPEGWTVTLEDGTVLTRDDLIAASE